MSTMFWILDGIKRLNKECDSKSLKRLIRERSNEWIMSAIEDPDRVPMVNPSSDRSTERIVTAIEIPKTRFRLL